MAKFIFKISYEINPEKREGYLALAKEMKQHLAGVKGKNYSIFEQKGRQNSFTEMFVCNSREEYDQLEDDQDEANSQLVARLDEFLMNGKMQYSTLIELI